MVAGEYALACEHAHSCCVLLARPDRFLRDGVWNTWIDYAKFNSLAASGEPFSSTDYRCALPLYRSVFCLHSVFCLSWLCGAVQMLQAAGCYAVRHCRRARIQHVRVV